MTSDRPAFTESDRQRSSDRKGQCILYRTGGQDTGMVRKKKLSPSGAKDDSGEYHNVHVNLHGDELAAAGMAIGDEVFVRVREDEIIVRNAGQDEVEHDS